MFLIVFHHNDCFHAEPNGYQDHIRLWPVSLFQHDGFDEGLWVYGMGVS